MLMIGNFLGGITGLVLALIGGITGAYILIAAIMILGMLGTVLTVHEPEPPSVPPFHWGARARPDRAVQIARFQLGVLDALPGNAGHVYRPVVPAILYEGRDAWRRRALRLHLFGIKLPATPLVRLRSSCCRCCLARSGVRCWRPA